MNEPAMSTQSEPLVSVVTPLYNGERYLAQCIESVLGQTYENWEYVLVNNCSTDRSMHVAEKYASKDGRIRIHNNRSFLGAIANHNHAFRQMSQDSHYCKVVHADDWLFPDCLEKMVGIASTYPSIGLVGCYTATNVGIRWGGLPYGSGFMPGPTVCRSALLGGPYVFGPPTTFLIRSDLIRQRKAFYNERHPYADTEACYDVLQTSDFGFVHQVLTFVRIHDKSLTSSFTNRLNTYLPAKLHSVAKYGPVYLTPDEYEGRLREVRGQYYRFLAKSIFHLRGREFWNYHRKELKDAGLPLSVARLVGMSSLVLVNALLNPKQTVEKCVARIRNIRGPRRDPNENSPDNK